MLDFIYSLISGLQNLNNSATPDLFSDSATYLKGERVMYNGSIYYCAIDSFTGPWDYSKWVDIGALITLNDLYEKLKLIYLYNSQIIYLERLLNILFDPIDKGIRIIDTDIAEANYFYKRSEGVNNFVYRRSEGVDNYIFRRQELSIGTVHYRIIVPVSLGFSEFNAKQLRQVVNIYNLAGRSFDVKYN